MSEDPDLTSGIKNSATNTDTCDDDIIDLTTPALQSEHTNGLDSIPQEGGGLFFTPSDMGSTVPSWSLLANLLDAESSNHNAAPQEPSPPPPSPPPRDIWQTQHGHYGNAALGGALTGDKWAVPVPRTLITELDWGDQGCNTRPMAVEEIEDTPASEGRPGVLGSHGDDDDHDPCIQVATAIMDPHSGKPESELSREEKIWLLAEKAGSTLPEDRVELDFGTKQRVKDRLKKSGFVDKVSLAF